jgi:hypothetical protein
MILPDLGINVYRGSRVLRALAIQRATDDLFIGRALQTKAPMDFPVGAQDYVCDAEI